jgi:hypothetical protein
MIHCWPGRGRPRPSGCYPWEPIRSGWDGCETRSCGISVAQATRISQDPLARGAPHWDCSRSNGRPSNRCVWSRSGSHHRHWRGFDQSRSRPAQQYSDSPLNGSHLSPVRSACLPSGCQRLRYPGSDQLRCCPQESSAEIPQGSAASRQHPNRLGLGRVRWLRAGRSRAGSGCRVPNGPGRNLARWSRDHFPPRLAGSVRPAVRSCGERRRCSAPVRSRERQLPEPGR